MTVGARNGYELQGKEAKAALPDEFFDQELDLNGRLHLTTRVVIASNSPVLVSYLIIAGDKLPLKVRLNLHHKAMILQV